MAVSRGVARLRRAYDVVLNKNLRPSDQITSYRHFISSAFTPNSKYYDSQSGRWMNIPGAAGIRIHDTTLSGKNTLPLEERFHLLETLIAARPYSAQIWEGAVEEMRRSRWMNEAPVNMVAKVAKPEQCEPELYRAVRLSYILKTRQHGCISPKKSKHGMLFYQRNGIVILRYHTARL